MSRKIKYWIELSDYDIVTSKVMLRGKRYLYVGFMAHQSIEKILKAFFVKENDKTPPFSHRLSLLAKKTSLYELFSEEQKELLDILEPMNIEARYPTHKELLLKSLTKERCLQIQEKAERLQKWIKKRL